MKFFKISLIFSAFALFLVFGCQKTAEQLTPVFVEKTFYPTGEEDAKSRVLTFLGAVEAQKKGVASRTTFQDMEVNEGRWTLEGAANYEKNVNLSARDVSEVQTYSISIDNLVENGTIKMLGSDMTSEYTALLVSVNTDESSLGKLASVADMKILGVDATKTDLEVTVNFVDPTSQAPAGDMTFLEAAGQVAEYVNDLNYNPNPGCWIPDPSMFTQFGVVLSCMDIGNPCFHEAFPPFDPNGLDYLKPWLDDDKPLANSIAQEFVYNLNHPTPMDPAIAQFPYDLEFVLMGEQSLQSPTGVILSKTLAVVNITCAQYTYCQ